MIRLTDRGGGFNTSMEVKDERKNPLLAPELRDLIEKGGYELSVPLIGVAVGTALGIQKWGTFFIFALL